MEDFNRQLYQSLKWIQENNVEECMLTFVNSNNEELIENGKNIDVTNDNKNIYIDCIKNIFYEKIFDLLHKNSFKKIIVDNLKILLISNKSCCCSVFIYSNKMLSSLYFEALIAEAASLPNSKKGFKNPPTIPKTGGLNEI